MPATTQGRTVCGLSGGVPLPKGRALPSVGVPHRWQNFAVALI